MAELVNVRFSPALSVVPGTRPRLVRIEAVTDPSLNPQVEASDWRSRVRRPSIAEVVSTFLRAASVGCFSSSLPETPTVRHSGEREEQGFMLYEAEVSFPALPAGAFAILGRMAKCSEALSNGLTSVSIQEIASAELPRVSLEKLAPLSAPEVPFTVDNAVEGEKKEIRAVVTFAATVSEAGMNAARAFFATWGAVLALGGFPGSGLPFSTGGVTDVARHLPEEVIATLELWNCKGEGWDALLRALSCLHASERIVSVEIY